MENEGRPIIFLVEDSLAHQTVLQRILQSEGYDVHVFASGEHALVRLAEVVPEVLVTDVHLPGVSGYTLLAHVRTELRLAGLPVVFVSVSAESLALEATGQGGPDAVLSKPVDKDKLLSTIRRLLSDPESPDRALADVLLLET